MWTNWSWPCCWARCLRAWADRRAWAGNSAAGWEGEGGDAGAARAEEEGGGVDDDTARAGDLYRSGIQISNFGFPGLIKVSLFSD